MHVLIATDGSDQSIIAARRATELLCTANNITLLTVVTEIPGDDAGGFAGSVYSPEEQERAWDAELAGAGHELQQTAAALQGAQVDKRIEAGDAANTITSVAENIGADVIVVGSHGKTGFRRFLLGSVSEHVVRHAPCPVLVIREPRAQRILGRIVTSASRSARGGCAARTVRAAARRAAGPGGRAARRRRATRGGQREQLLELRPETRS